MMARDSKLFEAAVGGWQKWQSYADSLSRQDLRSIEPELEAIVRELASFIDSATTAREDVRSRIKQFDQAVEQVQRVRRQSMPMVSLRRFRNRLPRKRTEP